MFSEPSSIQTFSSHIGESPPKPAAAAQMLQWLVFGVASSSPFLISTFFKHVACINHLITTLALIIPQIVRQAACTSALIKFFPRIEEGQKKERNCLCSLNF